MSKWSVVIPVSADAIYEVEADSEKEAISKAIEEHGVPMLCHRCSDHVEICDLNTEAAHAGPSEE